MLFPVSISMDIQELDEFKTAVLEMDVLICQKSYLVSKKHLFRPAFVQGIVLGGNSRDIWEK